MKKHKYDLEEDVDREKKAIFRIINILKKTPTQKEYVQYHLEGEPTINQLYYKYGTYNKALQALGVKPNPTRKPPPNRISVSDLVEEFISVSNKAGKILSSNEFRVNSKYSWAPYKTNWGSYNKAAEFIFSTNSNKFNFKHSFSNKKVFNPKLGSKLNYPCSLIYEPSNEYETIALFSIISLKLGFSIKKIKSSFPDAILIDSTNKEINAEFEYVSSNYLQHSHPLDFDGVVVCWRKDVDLGSIKIISLEEYLKGV